MDYINIIPTMTSNSTPSGLAFAKNYFGVGYEPFKAFNKINDAEGYAALRNNSSGFIGYIPEKQFIVNAYGIKSMASSSYFNALPRNWTFEGSVDTTDGLDGTWVVLDSRENQSWTTTSQLITYAFSNTKKYKAYRLNVSTNNGRHYFGLNELEFYGYEHIIKKFIYYNDEFYYFNNIWISLGQNPSLVEIENFGMYSITGSQIEIFELANGLDWQFVVWSDENVFESNLIEASPLPQLVYPTGDISLVGVEAMDKLTLLSTGNAKIAISFDRGATYKAFKNGIWETVENAHNGMTNLELNALTSQQIELERNGSAHARFSYSLSDNAEVDNIEMKVTLQGTEKLAESSSYDISYNESTNIIRYDIKRGGSYSVNFVDG